MLATCIYRANATEKDVISCIYVKPGNKLGTLGDFELVVDYASMISLDTVFKIL